MIRSADSGLQSADSEMQSADQEHKISARRCSSGRRGWNMIIEIVIFLLTLMSICWFNSLSVCLYIKIRIFLSVWLFV